MAKKNKTIENMVESNTKKLIQLYNMPTYELNRTLNNMSAKERDDLTDFCLAAVAASFIGSTQGTTEEKRKAFTAMLAMNVEQILELNVIFDAVKPRTTKQLHEIIQNINTYVVTLHINSYYHLGMYWKTVLVPTLSKEQRNPADVCGYENIGKKLCELNIAVLTQFGVLWMFENTDI